MPKAKFTPQQLVEVWMNAYRTNKGQAYVAAMLGVSQVAVSTRAKHLRLKGVNLPKLSSGADVDDLNRLIKEELKREDENYGGN